MGSSISQASGIARVTGRRTVAFIGDSTFFHSGLPALANAVQADDDVTVVILDNYITAMTGFQPSLTSGNGSLKEDPQTVSALASVAATPRGGRGSLRRPQGGDATGEEDAARFSIESAVRGLGVREMYSVDPFDEEATLSALKRAKSGTGVNVVICHSPCVVYQRRTTRGEARPPFAISRELCNACSLCVRVLGCPAILVVDGEYMIDQDLCDGCELCARICQHDAVRPAVADQ
jgi:indolepyruvate ferredoxin oxidoreductase alpha subunit